MDNLINNGGDQTSSQDPLDLGQGDLGQGGGILDAISQQQTPPVNSSGQGEGQQTDGQVPPSNDGQGTAQQGIDYKAEYERLKNIEQSYSNLRPEYTRVTQELSQLRKQARQQIPPSDGRLPMENTQPNHNQRPQLYQDPSTGNVYTIGENGQPVPYTGAPAYQDNQQHQVLDYVTRLVQPLYEQNLEIQMQNEIARMAVNREDFREVSPVMSQVLAEMPQLWELGQSQALEIAYSVGRNRLIEQHMASAVNDAKNSVLQNKDIKVLTGGNYTKPNQGNDALSPADAIKQSIISNINKSSIF